jgi:hypothetical protein
LFSQMFMLLTDAAQMSLINEVQLVFHSYFTIWIKMQLHYASMFCSGFSRFYTAAYFSIRSTM